MGRRKARAAGGIVSFSPVASSGVLPGGGEDTVRDSTGAASSAASRGSSNSGGTGETPSMLLREYCIKQKRLRFRFEKTARGSVRCVLPGGWKNQPRGKKGEPKAVVGEGKDDEHAAIAVLAEVEHGKPFHRVLQGEYRDLWKDLEARREKSEKEAQQRVAEYKAREKAIAESKKKAALAKSRAVHVHLSANSRLFIEDAVLTAKTSPNGASDPAETKARDTWDATARRLVRWGFAKADAEMAVQFGNGQYEQALDWLCMNLDESELPQSFAPKAEIEIVRDGIVVHAPVALDLSRQFATSRNAAERELRNNDGDVRRATRTLFEAIVGKSPETRAQRETSDETRKVRHDDGNEVRVEEEMMDEGEALSAIYEGHEVMCSKNEHGILGVSVKLFNPPAFPHGPLTLTFLDPMGSYPCCEPVVLVNAEKTMPGSLRRVIMRALTSEARRIRSPHPPGSPVVLLNDLIAYLNQTDKDKIVEDASELARQLQIARKAKALSDVPAEFAVQKEAEAEQGDETRMTPLRDNLKASATRVRRRRRVPVRCSEEMKQRRGSLPAWKKRREIAAAIQGNSVVVISGATGSGKTTQVPQFILDEIPDGKDNPEKFIIVTQPRRLAAVSVAQRVASERGQKCGEEVGYQVRLDSKMSHDSRLVFCTTGVMLRRLQGDPNIASITHVVVDEVHERSVETDILLLLLREVLKIRPDLHIILMSATLNAERFADYFSTTSTVQDSWDAEPSVPTLTIQGRTFPVQELFLEDAIRLSGFRVRPGDRGTRFRPQKTSTQSTDTTDSEAPFDTESATLEIIDDSFVNLDLIQSVIVAIDSKFVNNKDGSILVFLPGVADIKALISRLSKVAGLHPVPLHALLSSAGQAEAFSRPPRGKRKVVCSTNVAETSITVEDVVYVIDTARAKISGFDAENHASLLEEKFISKASARQRAGRAGRVQPGVCYRLLKKQTFAGLRNADEPELRRCSLDRTTLTILATLKRDPREMLRLTVDPPSEKAVEASMRSLESIGAITVEGASARKDSVKLTALGAHLATLPTDVRVGKLLIYASLFGCVEPALSIAAGMAERSPFPNIDVKQAFSWSKSDLLALAKLYSSYQSADDPNIFCEKFSLSRRTMESIGEGRTLLSNALQDAGFDIHANEFASAARVVKGVICAALYPNVVRVESPQQRYREVVGGAVVADDLIEARELKLRLRSGQRAFLENGSINFDENSLPSGWLTYYEKVRRGEGQQAKLYLRDSTMISPFALLLFGGEIAVRHERGLLTVDRWIDFSAPARVGVLVRELRQQLDQLLWKKISNSDLDLSNHTVLQAIIKLLREES